MQSGDWRPFTRRFSSDAVMTFAGVPLGPFAGRDAIDAAYHAHPPTDTMRVVRAHSEGATDVVRVAWSQGGGGTLRLTWSDDNEICGLSVTFDT